MGAWFNDKKGKGNARQSTALLWAFFFSVVSFWFCGFSIYDKEWRDLISSSQLAV